MLYNIDIVINFTSFCRDSKFCLASRVGKRHHGCGMEGANLLSFHYSKKSDSFLKVWRPPKNRQMNRKWKIDELEEFKWAANFHNYFLIGWRVNSRIPHPRKHKNLIKYHLGSCFLEYRVEHNWWERRQTEKKNCFLNLN